MGKSEIKGAERRALPCCTWLWQCIGVQHVLGCMTNMGTAQDGSSALAGRFHACFHA